MTDVLLTANTESPAEMFREAQPNPVTNKQILAIGNYCDFWAGGTVGGVIFAPVAGQNIRILAMNVFSSAAAITTVEFLNTGVGRCFALNAPSNASAPPNVQFPENKYGWFETNTGVGLSITVGAAAGVFVSFRYIVYTPAP